MYRDTVTRSWGPLSCHSSTAIASCFRTILHGPMPQGSVHNSWKLKLSQFFHGLHTHQTCYPLSMFGMLWINVYDSVFQFQLISSNFTQATINSLINSMRWRCVVLHEANGGHTRYWLVNQILVFWSMILPFYLRCLSPKDAYLICRLCEIHRLGPN